MWAYDFLAVIEDESGRLPPGCFLAGEDLPGEGVNRGLLKVIRVISYHLPRQS